MVRLGAAVAAINTDKSKALVALTSAALGLPGIAAHGAIPASNIIGNVSYGYYEESDNRMQVSVYHADSTIPLTDRLELAFSLDRDTYSGATPVFSLPETLTLLPASEYGTGLSIYKDLVSAASGTLGADTLTFRGGLETFKTVSELRSQFAIVNSNTIENRRTQISDNHITTVSDRTNTFNNATIAAESAYQDTLNSISSDLSALQTTYNSDIVTLGQQKTNEDNNYLALNPKPNSIEFSTTVDFGTGTTIMNPPEGAYYGKANLTPLSGGSCPNGDCFEQNGMVIGTIFDQTQTSAHLHPSGPSSLGGNRQINHHQDASGIYIRALDSSAFSLNSIKINARYDEDSNPYTPGQPNYDPSRHYWEILGFNSAVNANLADNDKSGKCADYSTCTAYQTFDNGFNGTLNLNSNFQNIKAAWIHFANYNNVGKFPNDLAFNILIDDINVSPSVIRVNWNSDLTTFRSSLNTQYNTLIANRTAQLKQEIENLNLDNDAINAAGAQRDVLVNNLTQAYENDIALLEQDRQSALADLPNLQKQLRYNSLVARYAAILNTITPTSTPALQRFAMQPQETRSMPQFTTNYYWGDSTLSFSGGYSDEPDFLSNFGSININHEFNDKLTTVSFGYGKTSNQITRSTPHAAGVGHSHDYASPNYQALNENSQFDSFNLGLSQVLGKNTLFQSTLNYTHQRGYLSNPYKYVYVRGEVTAEEYAQIANTIGDEDKTANFNWNDITHLEMVGIELFRDNRPRQRNLWSWSNRVNHHLPDLDATVHLDYRFFTDDWNINSHTMELKWFQSLANGWTVTPSLRYYSQSQAEFFAPYFLAPREDGFYSSDFRLSGFGTLGGGLTITKEFARGIKLETGFEYTTHSGDLKIGGGGVGNYADFDYFMAHANLSVDLSARSLAFLGGGSGDHTHHHHHGAAIPAGVMFGHMMNQADAIMVGYRFMYGLQSGSMRHGDSFADDLTLVNNGCESYAPGCLYKPTKMHMYMHMLDLMYAPTDWLNIMVMPQLMSMDMSMSNELRQPTSSEEDSAHGGARHTSNDIGDTIVTALVKVVDNGTHHIHVGIGVSAPTGSIDAELSPPQLVSSSGTKIDTSSINLQDYGMQLGSGTWDFKPSLTYSGQIKDWGWGLQFSGTKRLEYNKYGYAFGDQIQATGWGSYAIFNWLSATVRGVYTWQDHIQGRTNQASDSTSNVDFPSNYGGQFWDIGMGLSTSIRDGKFAGHSLAVEWLQPVHSDFNGYQLDRGGALTASWSFSF